ncbi:MAG: hypothetical protein Q7J29_02855 [Stagnimonas sp.]|nr:hypothetical protein [Stagnimonas sp.]
MKANRKINVTGKFIFLMAALILSFNASADPRMFLCQTCTNQTAAINKSKSLATPSVGTQEFWIFNSLQNLYWPVKVEKEPNGTGGLITSAYVDAAPNDLVEGYNLFSYIRQRLNSAQMAYDPNQTSTWNKSNGSVFYNLTSKDGGDSLHGILPIPIPAQACGCTNANKVVTDEQVALNVRNYLTSQVIARNFGAISLIWLRVAKFLINQSNVSTHTLRFEDGSTILVDIDPLGGSEVVRFQLDSVTNADGTRQSGNNVEGKENLNGGSTAGGGRRTFYAYQCTSGSISLGPNTFFYPTCSYYSTP